MGQCLKCGKETADRAVFCDACQSIMDQNPVKPGTVIHLPRRPAPQDRKTPQYEEPESAKQIKRLRGTVRMLTVLVTLMSVVLMFMAMALIRSITDRPEVSYIGRNYTTVDTTQ